ncbi:MAG: HD domain-containing protein [Candidatus Bathyarchaeota archaeon]|nr:HD domain-containing protein [Candidatus Bathyarchaeota archaeon]
MDPRLKKVVNRIQGRKLRKKIIQFVENPTIEIEGKEYEGVPLETAPAGLSHHHSYPGGYIEHVVATSEIALTLCDVAEKIYRGKVNRDLVLAGVLLHDIFKPLTYMERENGIFSVSPLAERMDHLTLIVSEMVRRGLPLHLIHIVCAHHGYRYGPIGPRTLEALVCHLADITDSKLNGEVLRAAQYLAREATGMELRQITGKEAFQIVHAKTMKGWEGVKKTVEKTRQKRQ